MANLGDDTTPVQGSEFSLPAGAKLGEDGGDLVVRDSAGEIILRRDETAGNWDFANTSLTNLAAVETEELDFGDAFQSPEQTPSVDNSETVIYEDFKYTIARFTVYGFDGDQIVSFIDEVIAFSGSGSNIEQTELGTRGTPDGRTYSNTGTELSLAMDAGDYAVTAMPMSLKRA